MAVVGRERDRVHVRGILAGRVAAVPRVLNAIRGAEGAIRVDRDRGNIALAIVRREEGPAGGIDGEVCGRLGGDHGPGGERGEFPRGCVHRVAHRLRLRGLDRVEEAFVGRERQPGRIEGLGGNHGFRQRARGGIEADRVNATAACLDVGAEENEVGGGRGSGHGNRRERTERYEHRERGGQ